MLRLIRELQLPGRPYHASVSNDGKRFAACTKAGLCWLFDHDLRQLDERDLGSGVEWIQLDETGSTLLAGFDDHIEGYSTGRNLAPLLRLPIARTSCYSCVFRSADRVLCVASWDREPKITAVDLESSAMIAETLLPRRGGGGYDLVPHPEGEAMAAIAFSGQSEEWMFWTHYARGQFQVFLEPEILDVSFPCFHPSGREFVSHHERLGLCRMQFPSGKLMASVQPEEIFPDNPDDPFSYDIHFLRNDRVLAWQCNLGLYELDLATLRPTAAVLMGVDDMLFGQGLFFSEQSWQMAGTRLLTSDCRHDKTFKHRIDTLRLWDAVELCGPILPPDPMRPYTQALLAKGG